MGSRQPDDAPDLPYNVTLFTEQTNGRLMYLLKDHTEEMMHY
jgi:hypothetical protein